MIIRREISSQHVGIRSSQKGNPGENGEGMKRKGRM